MVTVVPGKVNLLNKYNIPVPRYTSYPTVPFWRNDFAAREWKLACAELGGDVPPQISLYIHLPFCESLCTYCGCNKKITTNHKVEDDYIAAIHKEWAMYQQVFKVPPVLRELHLGGGTPTFFSPANLQFLLQPILSSVVVHEKQEFSLEGHPNNTTPEHLRALYDLGFRRVSFGVQDNDPEVQRVINRMQPFANVEQVTSRARQVGYTSVNYDLIYGLPKQTRESIARTVAQVISQRPDRIAFYSYAHVPWTSRGQRLFDENDLPTGEDKQALYNIGKQLFVAAGYSDIGMDHFALPGDELFIARQADRLHRNFMGYTTTNTDVLIGLGVSAISSLPGAYGQNVKTLKEYYDVVNEGAWPVVKGCKLTEEDKRFGGYIRSISCTGKVVFDRRDMETINAHCMAKLQELSADGLVVLSDNGLSVTALGKSFIRNVCAVFDMYLVRAAGLPSQAQFSRAI